MKLLLKISTTVLSFFVFISSFTIVSAIDLASVADLVKTIPEDNIYTAMNDFCKKRSGELMNLETWFSGKCDPETPSLSGEGVGFADIVLLQLLEPVFRPQYKSLPEQIVETVEFITNLKQSNNATEYKSNLAILQNSDLNQNIVSKLALGTQKMFEYKPASSVEYLAYVSNNLKNNKIINNAYAVESSYGFRALSPILPLWKAFRNIAYMLFAIAFILYGVMIMFRVRIDGKTAASITLAIPKLVTTLLLITFSYAIVGLLIDLSTIATAIAIDVLRVGELITDSDNFLIKMSGGNALGVFGSFIVNFLSSFVVSPFIVFNLLVGGLTGIGLTVIGTTLAWISGLGMVLTVVLFFSVGFAYFKLTLKLFQSYFAVIISLIFSPIILLGNVMPGSKTFSKWMTNMVGNLAVFPAASFLLTLSYILMLQPVVSLFGGADNALLGIKDLTSDNFQGLWTPPLTIPAHLDGGQNVNPIAGNAVPSLMLATLGVGLLLMASKYVDMISEALKVEPFKYGTAIGEALKYGYKQTSNPESSYRQSRLGNALNTASEWQYNNIGPGKVTGNTLHKDLESVAGKP